MKNKINLLEISLSGMYYKKDITDKYLFKKTQLVISEDAVDKLDKPDEIFYVISSEDYKKLKEENKRLSKNQRYYKDGIFSLEYDKETMSDMIDYYKSRIYKAIEYIEELYTRYIADYSDIERLEKILKGEE